MRVAVYAGSFDPPTKGHLWMILQGSRLFDNLVVMVTQNPSKSRSLIGTDAAVKLINELVQIYGLYNVSVRQSNTTQYLVEQAYKLGAEWLLRGIRDGKDEQYENELMQANLRICPDVNTVFLIPPDYLKTVSSTVVRQLLGYEGWEFAIKKYLPRNVYDVILNQGSGLYLLLDKLGIPAGVYQNYAEVTRKYHTLSHISDLYELFYKNDIMIQHPVDMLFAIWYHDAIYDPLRTDNEERSCRLFRKHPLPKIKTLNKARVERLIMFTKLNPNLKNIENDCKVFRSMDQAILDASKEERAEFEYLVRLEYAHVPQKEYDNARREVLERLQKLKGKTTVTLNTQ